jgi:hypothetical protein
METTPSLKMEDKVHTFSEDSWDYRCVGLEDPCSPLEKLEGRGEKYSDGQSRLHGLANDARLSSNSRYDPKSLIYSPTASVP